MIRRELDPVVMSIIKEEAYDEQGNYIYKKAIEFVKGDLTNRTILCDHCAKLIENNDKMIGTIVLDPQQESAYFLNASKYWCSECYENKFKNEVPFFKTPEGKKMAELYLKNYEQYIKDKAPYWDRFRSQLKKELNVDENIFSNYQQGKKTSLDMKK